MIRAPRPIPRQIAALALGHVQYRLCPQLLDVVLKSLLFQSEEAAKADVETRRNAIRSLAMIVIQRSNDEGLLGKWQIPSTSQNLTPVDGAQFADSFEAFLEALNDYSTDQRGDIGSWVRGAGLAALGQAITVAAAQAKPLGLLSQQTFQAAIGGIVKLGVEKLEPVRMASWRAWRDMRAARVQEKWKWEGEAIWSFETKDAR